MENKENSGPPAAGSGSVASLADWYQGALEQETALEQQLSDAKKVTQQFKSALMDAMLEEETTSIGRNGRKYTLVSKSKYSKKSGMEPELFSLLREQGLGDLITETVNANTLSATMRTIAEDNDGDLPEEWKDCINVYDYTDISVRKG